MTYDERKKELVKLLYQRYGSLALTRRRAAEALCTSTATLDRWRNEGLGPRHKKQKTKGKNGSVYYAIDALAEFIISDNIETA